MDRFLHPAGDKKVSTRHFTSAALDILVLERATIEAPEKRWRAWRRRGLGDLKARFIAEMRAPVSPYRVLANLAVTIVLLSLFFAVTRHLDWITQHLSLNWLFATILLASFGLFYVRRFFRVGYGLLEIVLGSVIVFDTIFGPTPDPRSGEAIVKIAAGMYLTIRGIDNCMQWLTPALEGAPAWVRGIFRSD